LFYIFISLLLSYLFCWSSLIATFYSVFGVCLNWRLLTGCIYSIVMLLVCLTSGSKYYIHFSKTNLTKSGQNAHCHTLSYAYTPTITLLYLS
jgi:hypothetical protein